MSDGKPEARDRHIRAWVVLGALSLCLGVVLAFVFGMFTVNIDASPDAVDQGDGDLWLFIPLLLPSLLLLCARRRVTRFLDSMAGRPR